MKIGIAGVGGIGSNVAVNLVRSGITWLRLIDFDRVDRSNLNRQFYFHDQTGRLKVEALAENLRRINPDLTLECVCETVTNANCRQLLADCDIIVEGFDRQDLKKMLIEALHDRLVISACGIAGQSIAGIRTRRLGRCFVAGDFITDCAQAPLFAHKVITVANHMSQLILEHKESYATVITA